MTSLALPSPHSPPRTNWHDIVRTAAEIVRSYDTSVTLRQLFYRLVSIQLLPNTRSAYTQLSSRTAEARRAGWFPPLLDRGRQIHRASSWDSPLQILSAARDTYRVDRTEGQDVSNYLGVEKAGMVMQLQAWFGELGLPVLALGGYSSQTYVDAVKKDAAQFERPAILLYGGDFDPSGEDIDRDFTERAGCWDQVVRVALTAHQVGHYRLPVNAGKATDTRSRSFVARHGALMQVELDALAPEDLRRLYQEAIDEFWDPDAYAEALERESEGRATIARAVDGLESAGDP